MFTPTTSQNILENVCLKGAPIAVKDLKVADLFKMSNQNHPRKADVTGTLHRRSKATGFEYTFDCKT